MSRTSFVICITRTSTKNKFAPTATAGRDFDVVTADGAMDIFHMKEYLLSLSQGQRLLYSAASGRTSPVHSHHSYNDFYIGEIV